MKNVLLGLAVACLTVACASQQKASVGDAEALPTTECGTDCESACCDAPSECSTEKAAECSTEGSEQKVCPVTGTPIS